MKMYLFWLVLKKLGTGFIRFYDWAVDSQSPRFRLYRSDFAALLQEISRLVLVLPVAWLASGWLTDLLLDVTTMVLEAVLRALPMWLTSGAALARNPVALWLTMSAAMLLNRFLASRRSPGPSPVPSVPVPSESRAVENSHD